MLLCARVLGANSVSFEIDEDDHVYPTSPGRIRMMRALALGLGLILFLFLIVALAL